VELAATFWRGDTRCLVFFWLFVTFHHPSTLMTCHFIITDATFLPFYLDRGAWSWQIGYAAFCEAMA
jgi:hypothetical protein